MQALWNDTVIAESVGTVVVEGNHYFPLLSLLRDYGVAFWKGVRVVS